MFEATLLENRPLGTCRGARPWLGRRMAEPCQQPSRLLTRTASNAYFPQVLGVLSLPDRGEAVDTAVAELWDHLQIVDKASELAVVKKWPHVADRLAPFEDDEVLRAIRRRKPGSAEDRPLKQVELEALIAAPDGFGEDVPIDPDFHARRLPDVVWRRTDLVWSGPEVPGLHARDTRRVYQELLGSAVRSLWLSTYVFSDGSRAFAVLGQRMAEVPELRVTLLLNIQRRRGDTTSAEALVRHFADRFWSVGWPGSVRPRVYYDPRALELDGRGGVLHAKAVVADEETVFVTSANLTDAAFERNIELGLLVRDRALAGAVVAHFRTLIDGHWLHLLPGQ